MRKPYQLILLLLLPALHSFAQEEKVVVRFADNTTAKPLSNVQLLGKNGIPVSKSDSAGYTVIPYNMFGNGGYLIALHIGYAPDTLYSPAATIYLHTLSQELKPATVYGNKSSRLLRFANEYVADYDFAGDNILVATYSGNNGKNAKLFLINNGGDVLNMCKLPHEPLSLFTSCVGSYYCVCTDQFYPLATTNNTIALKAPYDISLLPGLLQCEQSIEGNLYYRTGNKTDFRVEYGMIAKNDSVFKNILKFEESDEAYESRQEYIEILILLESAQYAAAARKYHLRDKWDRGAYAHINLPLFTTSDTLVIFDYFKKCIRYYDQYGKPVGTCSIQFEWRPNQRFEIIKDEALNKFYIHRFKDMNTQSLEELNIHTGAVGPKILIEKPLVEKVKVHNGNIYYLWQDARMGTTRQLFIQRM